MTGTNATTLMGSKPVGGAPLQADIDAGATIDFGRWLHFADEVPTTRTQRSRGRPGL